MTNSNLNQPKAIIIALAFAHQNYLTVHCQLLSTEFKLSRLEVDTAPVIKKLYSRRGFLSLPLEVAYFVVKLLKERPSLVLTVGPKLGFLLSMICFFLPGVKHVHWYTGQVWGAAPKPNRKLSFWCDRVVARFADVLFTDGPTQRDVLLKAFGGNHIIHCPEGGSISGLNEKYDVKQRFGLTISGSDRKSSRLRVLFVGRLTLDKGLDVISGLAKWSHESGYGFSFTVAGPKDETFEEYDAWVLELPSNVNVVPRMVDPVEFYTTHDVFILPSLREGFGIVNLEAQAYGLPVLCSDIYGLRDSFIESRSGISCRGLDDYKAALIKLSSKDVYERFSSNAQEFSREFLPDQFVPKLAACYVAAGVLSDV